MSPFLISLTVALSATLASLPAGVLLAWYLERSRLPGRDLIHCLVLLPLVLPPVVVGYLLLSVFSPRGALGKALETVGAPVAFHWLGAVVAAAVVGFPLLVMMIGLAMKAVDPRYETASRALGRSDWQTFWRVTLPLSWPGILAGCAIALARGLGEFGATIVFVGSVPGETETIPLAVHAQLARPGGEARIRTLVLASVLLCLGLVVAARALDRWHRRRLEIDR